VLVTVNNLLENLGLLLVLKRCSSNLSSGQV
jgi:hypothetical protein